MPLTPDEDRRIRRLEDGLRRLDQMLRATSGRELLRTGLLVEELDSAVRTETDGVPVGLFHAYDDGNNVFIGRFGSNGWQYVQLS